MATDPTAEAGRVIGGVHNSSIADTKLKVDTRALKDLKAGFDQVKGSVDALKKSMDALAASSAKVSSAGGRGANKAQNGMPLFNSTSLPINTPPSPTSTAAASGGGGGGGISGMLGGLFGGGSGGGRSPGMGAGMSAVMAVGAVGGQLMGALDDRIARGAEYAANADRYNVVMQQQYGLSQNQVMNQMRRPLAGFRLGANGINQMMGFQQKYGFEATPQLAKSFEGINAIQGYQKGMSGMLADQAALMDPDTSNRMFNMLGVSAYKVGGGLNDPMKMRQEIVTAMGLTTADSLKGAKAPGSRTRYQMADAGINESMQDEILTFAQDNVAFQAKTGGKQGMYDPSNKEHRKIMGIEGNYATQLEETDRVNQNREENFARRQLDNYATQEKLTQELIKALGSLEDTLSGLIGSRVSGGGIMKMAGKIMQVGGILAAPFTGGASLGLTAAGTVLAGSGDPVSADGGASGSGSNSGSTSAGGDANIKIPVGYNGKTATLNEVKQRSDFSKLNPKMQDRLLSLFRANPRIGIGGGFRDSASQEKMFRERYRPTNKKTDTFWNNQYWEHVSGAAAAPPGRSMHEIGLAADLVGDLNWLKSNAGRFGLRSFWDVNNEPWHVQPAELPASRRKYEEGGATWGTDNGYDAANGGTRSGPVTGVDTPDDHAGGEGGAPGLIGTQFGGMSLPEIIAQISGDTSVRRGVTGLIEKRPGNPTTAGATGSSVAGSGEALSGVEVARLARAAGFGNDQLVQIVAIAGRESGWKPRAMNPDLSTFDQSYGLWQLNTLNNKEKGMMGDLWNDWLGKPRGNKNFDELYDPATNARGAKYLSSRSGNTLRPWGEYKGKSNTHEVGSWMAKAQDAVAQLGDPTGGEGWRGGSGGSGSTNISSAPTYNITVAPQITFAGSPSTPDLRNIAQQVTALIEENVRTLKMRSA